MRSTIPAPRTWLSTCLSSVGALSELLCLDSAFESLVVTRSIRRQLTEHLSGQEPIGVTARAEAVELHGSIFRHLGMFQGCAFCRSVVFIDCL